MDRKRYLLGILVIACLAIPAYATSDPYEVYHQQFIPVEEISLQGTEVVVTYTMELALSPQEFGQDLLYIFGRTTREYPSARSILIRCLVGDEPVYEYRLSTQDIRDFVGGRMTGADLISRITLTDYLSPTGLIFESRWRPTGSTVQIPVRLAGISERIGNMDLILTYDPRILRADEVLRGGLTENTLFDSNIEGGRIRIAIASKDGISGEGSIAFVKFTVTGSAGATSPLTIAELTANRANDLGTLTIPTQNGVFTVITASEARGDASGDRKVRALDALMALQMAVGKRAEDLTLDMDSNGKVTSLDARMILKQAVE